MDIVSVIIPVYMVAKYLPRCLDSVCAQSYNQLEILLIDDGSLDESGEICDAYAYADPRIIVIHKKNEGLSSARNVGLKICTGDYVSFCDSDDYFVTNMIEAMHDLCLWHSSDISVCKMNINEVDTTIYEEEVKVLKRNEFMPLILQDIISSHTTNKLFRRKVFTGITFPLGYSVQDMMTLYKVFSKAESVVMTNKKYYVYYAERPDNTSNGIGSFVRSPIHRSIAFYYLYQYAKKYYPEHDGVAFKNYIEFGLGGIHNRIRNRDTKYDKDIETVIKNIKANTRRALFGKEINLTRKCAIIVVLLGSVILSWKHFNNSRDNNADIQESKNKPAYLKEEYPYHTIGDSISSTIELKQKKGIYEIKCMNPMCDMCIRSQGIRIRAILDRIVQDGCVECGKSEYIIREVDMRIQ